MFFQEMLVLVVVFVTLKSVCGLRLSRMIGVLFFSFLLCFWVIDLLIWCVGWCVVCLVWWWCCIFVWVVLLCGVSCLFVCVCGGRVSFAVYLWVVVWCCWCIFGDVFVYVDF